MLHVVSKPPQPWDPWRAPSAALRRSGCGPRLGSVAKPPGIGSASRRKPKPTPFISFLSSLFFLGGEGGRTCKLHFQTSPPPPEKKTAKSKSKIHGEVGGRSQGVGTIRDLSDQGLRLASGTCWSLDPCARLQVTKTSLGSPKKRKPKRCQVKIAETLS